MRLTMQRSSQSHHAKRRATLASLAVGSTLVLAACGNSGGTGSTSAGSGSANGSGAGGSSSTHATRKSGGSISVAFYVPPPPKADLAAFEKSTGIQVHWTEYGYDAIQTKLAAAAEAHTYFADVTDADVTNVGRFANLHFFEPLNNQIPLAAWKKQFPALGGETIDGKVYGIPIDNAALVTTINTKDFHEAGITKIPTTLAAYTKDLQTIKSKGIVAHPLGIPFAAAEGLSTYWYEVTAAMGGNVLGPNLQPEFASPSSPGYKAMEWMVNAYKSGLVPPQNLSLTDGQNISQNMAHNRVASTFSEYTGDVEGVYNVPSSSSVVGQVKYIRTPGVNGPGPNLGVQDGLGVPVTAHNPTAAITFMKWFVSTANQAKWAGAQGTKKTYKGFAFNPVSIDATKILAQSGHDPEGQTILQLAKSTRPIFPNGSPPWYPNWSQAVYTNIHQAAAGSETVATAIKNILSTVSQLRQGS